jgi:RNA polymerase sigma factor (sigma-70 family)
MEISAQEREQLLKSCAAVVSGMFKRYARGGYEWGDFLNDVIVNAWKRPFVVYERDSPDVIEKRFAAFLRTIARNLAIDRHRKQKTQLVSDPGLTTSRDGLKQIAGREKTPSKEARARERRARLQKALAVLPPLDRRLVVMRFFRGLSPAEIANEIAPHARLTPEAIGMRIKRAMDRLNEELGGTASDYLSG